MGHGEGAEGVLRVGGPSAAGPGHGRRRRAGLRDLPVQDPLREHLEVGGPGRGAPVRDRGHRRDRGRRGRRIHGRRGRGRGSPAGGSGRGGRGEAVKK